MKELFYVSAIVGGDGLHALLLQLGRAGAANVEVRPVEGVPKEKGHKAAGAAGRPPKTTNSGVSIRQKLREYFDGHVGKHIPVVDLRKLLAADGVENMTTLYPTLTALIEQGYITRVVAGIYMRPAQSTEQTAPTNGSGAHEEQEGEPLTGQEVLEQFIRGKTEITRKQAREAFIATGRFKPSGFDGAFHIFAQAHLTKKPGEVGTYLVHSHR